MARARQEIVELNVGEYFGFVDLRGPRLVLGSRSNLELLALSKDSQSVRFKTPGGRLKRMGDVEQLRDMLRTYNRVYTSYMEYVDDMKSQGKTPLPDPDPHPK